MSGLLGTGLVLHEQRRRRSGCRRRRRLSLHGRRWRAVRRTTSTCAAQPQQSDSGLQRRQPAPARSAAGAVTSVVVSCSTSDFTVGGTIDEPGGLGPRAPEQWRRRSAPRLGRAASLSRPRAERRAVQRDGRCAADRSGAVVHGHERIRAPSAARTSPAFRSAASRRSSRSAARSSGLNGSGLVLQNNGGRQSRDRSERRLQVPDVVAQRHAVQRHRR